MNAHRRLCARLPAVAASCALALIGCSQDPRDSLPNSAGQRPAEAGTAPPDAVFVGSLADCGGFTAADAARILDVSAARIAQQPDANATDNTYLCNFPDAEDWRGGLSFQLNREDTVQHARTTISRGHGLAAEAQQRIDEIIEAQTDDSPLILIPDLGDDIAYRMSVNHALTARVKNIVVVVMGGNLEQQKQVAAIVVDGLRAP